MYRALPCLSRKQQQSASSTRAQQLRGIMPYTTPPFVAVFGEITEELLSLLWLLQFFSRISVHSVLLVMGVFRRGAYIYTHSDTEGQRGPSELSLIHI